MITFLLPSLFMSSRSLSSAPNHLFLCSGSFLEKFFSLQFFSFWYVCAYVCASVCAGVYGRQKHSLDILPRVQVPFFLQGTLLCPSFQCWDYRRTLPQPAFNISRYYTLVFIHERQALFWLSSHFLKKNSLMLVLLIFVSNLISLNTECVWGGSKLSLSLESRQLQLSLLRLHVPCFLIGIGPIPNFILQSKTQTLHPFSSSHSCLLLLLQAVRYLYFLG